MARLQANMAGRHGGRVLGETPRYYDPPNLTWPFAVYIVTVEGRQGKNRPSGDVLAGWSAGPTGLRGSGSNPIDRRGPRSWGGGPDRGRTPMGPACSFITFRRRRPTASGSNYMGTTCCRAAWGGPPGYELPQAKGRPRPLPATTPIGRQGDRAEWRPRWAGPGRLRQTRFHGTRWAGTGVRKHRHGRVACRDPGSGKALT